MPVDWSDEVDEILGGDLAAGFAYLTPAKGVVITPMAPLGLRDREAGTVTLPPRWTCGRSSTGSAAERRGGRLPRARARPHRRPGFVLVQGRASFDPGPTARGSSRSRPSGTASWARAPAAPRPAARRLLPAARGDHGRGRADRRLPRRPGRGHPRSSGPARRHRRAPGRPRRDGATALDSRRRLRATRGASPHPARLVRGRRAARGGARRGAGEATSEGSPGCPGRVPAERSAGRAHLARVRPRMIGQEQRIHTGWL